MGARLAPGGAVRTSPPSHSEEATLPVLPSRKPGPRGRARSVTVRLSSELEERLRERLADTGLPRSEAIGRLLEFALDLEAQLQDLEPELSCHAANRSVPIARALVQLAGRSLGIEPVDLVMPLSAPA